MYVKIHLTPGTRMKINNFYFKPLSFGTLLTQISLQIAI